MMRGGIKRSRNGCCNCKERRLKCDETKPSCRRCIKRGIRCEGHSNVWRWAAQYPNVEFLTGENDQDLGDENVSNPSAAESEALLTNIVVTDVDGDEESADTDVVQFDQEQLYDIPAFDSALYNPMPHFDNLENFPVSDDIFNNSSSFPLPTTYRPSHQQRSPSSIRSSLRVATELEPNDPYRNRLSSVSSGGIYRQSASSVPVQLRDQTSVLVEYYFKEVAGLFSCYDGRMNPFRSNVAQLWGSSASIYYTIQSMAAACLIDVIPSLSTNGLMLRQKATAAIDLELSVPSPNTESLLALVMLGLTASWHESNNLGKAEFDRAQRAFEVMRLEKRARHAEKDDRNLQFFHKALLYWEMLMSYVVDDDASSFFSTSPRPAPKDICAKTEEKNGMKAKLPHPWTGVACDAQTLVFEIGKLIRQRKKRMRRRSWIEESPKEVRERKKESVVARELEARLRCLVFTDEDAIVDPGDTETSVGHLLKIAECYRGTGLLQLYRVFPDLSPAGKPMDQQASDSFSIALATKIVGLLKSIPIESGTRCVQPFLLVAVASELRVPVCSQSNTSSTHGNDPSLPFESGFDSTRGDEIKTSTMDILQARKFVMSRLSLFEHILPAKPVRQMLEVINETWKRMDEGMEAVYWMDIMMEKGWETIMG